MAGRVGFAVLGNDVDLDERTGKKKADKPKQRPADDAAKKSAGNKPSSKNQKKKTPQAAAAAANHGQQSCGSGKSKNKKKSGKAVNGTDKDNQTGSREKQLSKDVDDEWQRRDDEFVRDENEKSLQEAMMLSKLDFEEKKEFYAQMKKEQQDERRGNKGKKKKDKPLTMSLDQFNSFDPHQMSEGQEIKDPEGGTEKQQEEEKFFENIAEAARKTLEKEDRYENYKNTASQYNQSLRESHYEAELEKRDFEIQALRLEVESLKDELKSVKGRSKKLCEVISASEMRSKAELVIQLDDMTKVRDELTQEVLKLNTQLEQERSKVNQLDVKKAHGRKKQNADGHKD